MCAGMQFNADAEESASADIHEGDRVEVREDNATGSLFGSLGSAMLAGKTGRVVGVYPERAFPIRVQFEGEPEFTGIVSGLPGVPLYAEDLKVLEHEHEAVAA